eukprot:TRINITY_DN1022_c0_g1_i1.p1 TRINITY_DN1022_c0_g1~~TRINITY_DN1022_c0_g1_i1.p1  ORF type:complete len:137 (-),score=27.55 TRINITY_DN1022_c0_g1_i1:56-466(-)
MYMDEAGNEVPNPDPLSGLYIASRDGSVVKATIPSDHLIYQIGETAQIHSGGILQATPHCVRAASGPQSKGISRETFAVFMEPMWMEPMDCPPGVQADNVSLTSSVLPPGVPPLASRWKIGMSFAEFTDKTLSSYY